TRPTALLYSFYCLHRRTVPGSLPTACGPSEPRPDTPTLTGHTLHRALRLVPSAILIGDCSVPTLLERLGQALWPTDRKLCCDPSSPALHIAVRCDKCGEIIHSRVEKAYELEAEYEAGNGHHPADEDEEPKPSGYSLHKEFVGAGCQNLIHVVMRLDSHRCITARNIEGGQFVEIQDCE
ncbi:MAG: hypothetical protein KKI08_00150, partial [Armatimonadetes bacterium]|nr:hypothetical protein [Armatimonadota bacterium]